MSVFPKRAVAGETITLHTNVFSRHQTNVIYPYVTTIIRSPSGKTFPVFSGHVLVFPINAEKGDYKANKGFPFLLLAKMLGTGKDPEELKKTVENIRQGKHFYYHFTIPADAEAGKYVIETNNWLSGNQAVSATAPHDHFFVEKLTVKIQKNRASGKKTVIKNHSAELLPVRIVKISKNERITTRPLLIKGHAEIVIPFERKTFLLYNEERKCIAIDPDHKLAVVRNQKLLHKTLKEKGQKVTYIMQAPDDVVSLEGESQELWDAAIGLNLPESQVSDHERKLLQQMKRSGLLQCLDLENLIDT